MSERFSHSKDDLQARVHDMLAYARAHGASGCEAEASQGYGQSVTVRKGEVETIEYNRDKGISVSVYIGQRKGHASTSDFGTQALQAPQVVVPPSPLQQP